MKRHGHALYTGYDMRLRGCSAMITQIGKGTYAAQFDSVQEDPVFHPGVKTKPDDPKFNNTPVEDMTGPIALCLGWHLFEHCDFENVVWSAAP